MTNSLIGLLTTFLLGLFILIGAGIALLINKKTKVVDFSIGLAFGVILALVLTDLIPEIFENLGFRYIYIAVIFAFLGYFILKGLDYFIPDHHEHGSMSASESKENLSHIGFITTIALVLHNVIEGMAVYSTALSDSHLSLLLAIGVGFHNIPLGIVIASSFYQSSKNFNKTIISVFLVSISTLCGGLIMYLFNLTSISEIVLGILLSLTLGMLLFILINELWPRIRSTKDKKTIYIGISVGIVILLIGMLI